MKKKWMRGFIIATATISLVGCGTLSQQGTVESTEVVEESVSEGNEYYAVAQSVSITGQDMVTVLLDAKEGWMWNITDGLDVTSWMVREDLEPAFAEESGVAISKLIYGTAEGEEQEAPVQLQITIDMSKVSGFTENGSYDLYVYPTGKEVLWVTGENHGQYIDSAEKIGEINRPEVSADGIIEGESTVDGLSITSDQVDLVLTMEGIEDEKIDSSQAQVTLLEGDGYKTYEYEFDLGNVEDTWSQGIGTYTFGSVDGTFSPQGGDGNGHYNFRIAIDGLTYNGLPLSQVIVHTDIYAYGRTFSVDGGSLILGTEPLWSSEEDLPVLCDAYPDMFSIQWPVDVDASQLTAEDVSVAMVSEYGDRLELEAGTDYSVQAETANTTLILNYIYWAYAPVYSQLEVTVNTDNTSWNEEMYAPSDTYTHTYDIASVYVYSVMSGGPTGTQEWTYFGFSNLTDVSQVFRDATYYLSYTDEEGNTWYYGEDENQNGVLVSDASEGVAFVCNDEVDLHLENDTVKYTRLFDQTEEKTVDGTGILFTKEYVNCEVLQLPVSELSDMECLPGYTLGNSFEDHLKYSWQSFIGTGYQGGTK